MWGVLRVTEFQVAAWANQMKKGHGRSAGKTARYALLWIEEVTGEYVFAQSPLVKYQCRPTRPRGGIAEKPKPAKAPDLEVIRCFEHLVRGAPTAVQRCIAGFVTLLAYGSARTMDLLRSRGLRLTRDSLSGESIMKNPKHVWVRWIAPRQGLVTPDWAGDWLSALERIRRMAATCRQLS